MKITLYKAFNDGTAIGRILRYIGGQISSYGHQFKILRPTNKWQDTKGIINELYSSDLVIIWNGLEPCARWAKEVCIYRGILHFYIELPTLRHIPGFYFDPFGICGESSLCGGLDWVTPEILGYYRTTYRPIAVEWTGGGDYTLVPLQVPWDTQIVFFSPFRTMQQFVDHVVSLYPNERIIVARHPQCPQEQIRTNEQVQLAADPTPVAMKRAKRVVGMNSSFLLTAALSGVETHALAPCPLHFHGNEPHKLAAAYWWRHTPLGSPLRYYLSRIGINL